MAVLRRPIALAAVFVACAGGTAQAASDLAINQIYGGGGNAGATYSHDFVEVVNRGAAPVTLNHSIQYSSAAGTGLFSGNGITALSGTLQPGQRFLVGLASSNARSALRCRRRTRPAPRTWPARAGKVVLVDGPPAWPATAPRRRATPRRRRGSSTSSAMAHANYFEGAGAAPAISVTLVGAARRGRLPGHRRQRERLRRGGAEPAQHGRGRHAVHRGRPAPTVASTIPSDGATDVAPGAALSVTFSEPVSAPGAFSLDCAGAQALTVDRRPDDVHAHARRAAARGRLVLADRRRAAWSAIRTRSIRPTRWTADVVVDFTVAAADPCAAPATPIGAVQGSGAATPLAGSAVTVRGVVVGDYEGAAPALRGFYLQDAPATATRPRRTASSSSTARRQRGPRRRRARHRHGRGVPGPDADPAHAHDREVLRPATPSAPSTSRCPVAVGDLRSSAARACSCGCRRTLSVTEHFQLGRFGQVVVSSGGRLPQPTHLAPPGAPALAIAAANELNRIIVDDASNGQNPDPIVFGRGGNPLSASNTLRGGDTVTGAVGVLTYTWAGNAASGNAFRVRPLGALGGTADVHRGQPAARRARRTPARARSGSRRPTCSTTSTRSAPRRARSASAAASAECRGASNPTEFMRQSDKTVAELLGARTPT